MAFAMETLLFPSASMDLRLIASRIEENRVVAGVHYEHDGHMGRVLAAALSPIFAARLGLTSYAPAMDDVLSDWSGAGEAGAWDAAEQLAEGGAWPTGVAARKPVPADPEAAADATILQTAVALIAGEIGDAG